MIPKAPYALVNSAVDEILARFAALKDETGLKNIFKSAQRGAILIQPNVTPNIEQLPALRAWYEETEYDMGANNFVVIAANDGRGGIEIPINFDVYLYSFDKDKDGNPVDLQADLMNIEWAMMQWLQDIDGGDASEQYPNTFVHSQGIVKWYFLRGQKVKGSHGSVMQRFGGIHTLPPPWYTTTLKIQIEIYPYAVVGAPA